jgi:hypothetical protein
MNLLRENNIGGTRVSRVQFGVPPNCVEARGSAFYRPSSQSPRVPPVSGATPETTRRRRVPPTASERFYEP